MISLDQQIQALRELKLRADRIITACPFEAQKNLNGLLRPELFFDGQKGIYVSSSEHEELMTELLQAITSEPRRILFLHGHSGIGKSTFLRYFSYKHGHLFTEHFIDLHSSIEHVQDDGDTGNTTYANENPIVLGLQQFIRAQNGSILSKIVQQIAHHRKVMRDYAPNLTKAISHKDKTTSNDDFITDESYKLNLNDTLVVFFLLLMHLHENDKTTVVLFDNLDVVKLSYFSQTFAKVFPTVLGNMTHLSQEPGIFETPVDIADKFKFIFCMRDASYAQINPHKHDQLWDNIWRRKMRNNSAQSEKMLLRRLEFMAMLYKSDDMIGYPYLKISETRSIFQNLFTRKIVATTFLPLLNDDYRKFSILLFRIVTNPVHGAKDILAPKDEDIFFAVNSRIYNTIIKTLAKDNFIRTYYDTKVSTDQQAGFCHPARMITTVLMNHIHGPINDERHSRGIELDESLYSLVEEFRAIYPPLLLISTLTRLFDSERSSWVHPITISGKMMRGNQPLHREVELAKVALGQESSLLDKQGQPYSKDKAIRKLRKIKVRYNPSCRAFLRYVITNYDYYMVISKNERSLFSPEYLTKRKSTYAFEHAIENVQETVNDHVSMMRKFYQLKFEKGLNMSIDEYLDSSFTFKFFGDEELPREKGMLHENRVLSSHVEYLDRFRSYVISRIVATEEKRIVNFKLCKSIRKNVDLMRTSVDTFGQTLGNKLKERLDDIEGSDFLDFETPIST